MAEAAANSVEGANPGDNGSGPSSLRRRVLILCSLVCLLDGFDNVVAPIAAPLMAREWRLEPQAFSFALAAAILGSGLGAAFLAPLGDRFGRRPLVLVSFGVVGMSTLAISWASDVTQLALLRLATGIGLGASFATALALTSEYAPPHSRSRIVSTVYAMSAVGGALGGILAPALIQSGGWRHLYLFGGAVPLILFLILIFALPESRRFVALKEAPEATSGPAKGVLATLAALFASTFRTSTILLWVLYFFSMFTNYLILAWLPTLLSMSGWSVTNASFGVTAYAMGGVAGGFALGWFVDRARTRQSLLLGFGATGLALALLPFVPALVPVWLALIIVMGAGVVGISYALAAVAAALYPTSLRASGIGAAAAAGRVGAALAPVIGGLLLANGLSVIQIMTSLIAPMILALVIVQIFAHRLGVTETEDAEEGRA